MKKFFTGIVVAATMAWSMGIAAVLPVAAATPVDGDIIKTATNSAVYYVSGGKKMLFVNRGTYSTWSNAIGDATDKFATLKVVSQAEFDALGFGGNITLRPGTNLVKFTDSADVYAVGTGAKLYKLADSAAQTALYGTLGAVTLQSGFRANYYDNGNPVATLTASSKYPDGTVIKSGSDYYLVEGGNRRMITTDAFTANSLKESWARTVADVSAYGSGTNVSGKEAWSAITGSTSTVPTGSVTVSLASDTPSAKDVPSNTPVEMLKLIVTAGSDADVSINGIKLSASGLGNASEIDGVTVYNNNKRFGNSRDIDSNKQAQINFTSPIVVAKGTSQTILVKATLAGTGKYALGVNAAADISATASVAGSFPVVGNAMAGNSVTVATTTIEIDGSLSAVKLGDTQAVLAKFKLTNDNTEDSTFKAITLKKDSGSSASDDDFANLKLYMDGNEIASGGVINNRYVTFNLTSPITLLKSQVKRFVVKGDVVGGAGKNITLVLDTGADLIATGNFYGYQTRVVNNFTAGSSVSINAGAVTITKVNAVNTKLKKDTTNAEFGTFKVTVNSGKNVELSTLKLTIASTNDAAGSQLENVEVFLKNSNTTYDLVSSTFNGVYQNTSMGLVMTSGVTYEMVVRADITSGATNGDYTVSIANASADMVMKETGNDTAVTDITPNSVTLNKVQVEAASVTFSKNALSTGYSAVVGTADIEMMNFNIAAGQSTDIKVTQLIFADRETTPSSSKSVISEFKLWKGSTLLKTVSANDIVSPTVAPTITFSDLNETVKLGETNTYRLTLSLVSDPNQNTKKLKYGLSGYSVEDTDKGSALYDTTNDSFPATGDGTIDGTGVAALTSAREVTIAGYGTMSATTDNTISGTNYTSYQLAGTSGVALGSYKLKADNENVKVKQVKVESSADMSASISKLSLYKGTELVAWTTNIGATTSTLDQDFIVGSEAVYTLKADLTPIGQNETGTSTAATFKLAAFDAEGVSSGQSVVVADSAVSLETAIIASKIASVSLEQSAMGQSLASSILTGVSANVAIVKVTAPTWTNKNADGTELKLNISKLKVKVDGGLTTVTSSIQRIGGTGVSSPSTATSTSYLTFAGLSGVDYQLSSGETAYFLVKATPVFAATYAGQFGIKASLDAMNGTAGVANTAAEGAFNWVDISGALTKTEVRMPGISTIDGYTIKN